jgi:hydrogenase-4 component D
MRAGKILLLHASVVASMIGLVFSPNFFQLFIFWELTTLCSWGLIAFYRNDDALRSPTGAADYPRDGIVPRSGIILIYVNTALLNFPPLICFLPS